MTVMRPTQTLGRVVYLALVSMLLSTTPLPAQIITTTAGGFVGDGGPATSAGLAIPNFVIQDKSGNVYIADTRNYRIRHVTPSGTISTVAGTGIAGFSGDGGLARNAMLNLPTGLLLDSAGEMLVADRGNNRIRKIDRSGIITTIAGTGEAGNSGDGGPALLAELNSPMALSRDIFGNLYFSDRGNNSVRKIDTFGTISTVAGTGTAGYNGDGIPAIAAELNQPVGLSVDVAGNLFIGDFMNRRVRKVDKSGIITTFAGNGMPGFGGDGGLATNAEVDRPLGLLIVGNQLLISTAGSGRSHIRTVDFGSNIINTFAGSSDGFDGDGHPPLSTDFNGPLGMQLTASGSLLVADRYNARIREVTSSATGTRAGGPGSDNKLATLAVLIVPQNLTFDSGGNCYVAEWGGMRVRKVDACSGRITTVAGTGVTGYSGDGGPAAAAQINGPFGVAVDGTGNLFIADTGNNVIRKVDSSGIVTTFASDPNFSDLVSMATDKSGNLYSADDGACVIRKITPAGVISVVAGVEFNCGFNGDRIPATTALLNAPYGIAVDINGNLYIGDTGNNRIRRVNLSGFIRTVAGNGTCGFSGDGGSALAATICNPLGLAVDRKGDVYFADENNLRVRKITPLGKINTVAGSGISGYNGENLPAVSTNLDDPFAVGVNNAGTLFILDDAQARVRKVHCCSPPLALSAADKKSPR
jgi:sugar lactone lactonase YvrE